jgi:hypothetical protein
MVLEVGISVNRQETLRLRTQGVMRLFMGVSLSLCLGTM